MDVRKGSKIMATYEEIAKVNAEMGTTPIKGKQYAEVPQKIQAFRKLYPNGSLITEIISHANGVVVMKATAMDEGGNILGTGHAYEIEGSSLINKGSYIENCETSAWGRCLSACGLTGGSSVASAEELQNALLGQQKASAEDISKLKMLAVEKGVALEDIMRRYGLKNINDITNIDYVKAVNIMKGMR